MHLLEVKDLEAGISRQTKNIYDSRLFSRPFEWYYYVYSRNKATQGVTQPTGAPCPLKLVITKTVETLSGSMAGFITAYLDKPLSSMPTSVTVPIS